MERNLEADLQVQHVLLYAVVTESGQTPEQLLERLLGSRDQHKIRGFLRGLRERHSSEPHKLDPELDQLLRLDFERQHYWQGTTRVRAWGGYCCVCGQPAVYRMEAICEHDRRYCSKPACDELEHQKLAAAKARDVALAT